MEHVAIFGASRGLGQSLARHISEKDIRVSGFSRKGPFASDFTTEAGCLTVEKFLLEDPPDRIFFMAAGGPFGAFESKAWKDHQWAWNLTFLFPARILHFLLKHNLKPQTILIGSSVAENAGDQNAASYCAAKHALLGLYRTLRLENPDWDLRLYSPGYMDTPLLPPHAAVRNQGIHSPEAVARELWQWSLTGERGGHKMAARHP